MSKEYLEALERLYKCNDDDYTLGYQQHDYKLLQQALERLEAIDNENPSEALECLEELEQDIENRVILAEDRQLKLCAVIKQALIKSQEQEKVLNELLLLVKNLEPTFNRKGVSSDTDILGTIIKDYFYDNASDLLKRYFND